MTNQDAYQVVTDRVTAALEQGTVPWRRPWSLRAGQGNMPRSVDGRYYTGINQLLLWMEPHEDQRYGTYKAIQRHGGQVRKGEHGIDVVLWKPIPRKDPEPGQSRSFLLARIYRVFNVEQADWPNGLPRDRWLDEAEDRGPDFDPFEQAEAVWNDWPEDIRPTLVHGATGASYSPEQDLIRMPDRDTFKSAEGYYLTLWHEAAHSTGHADRLNRNEITTLNRFGSVPYSREELVAEMGAAMIAARTGIVPPDIDNTAAYVASWLKALRGDPKMLVQAAARAQKAADHILGPLNPPDPERTDQ